MRRLPEFGPEPRSPFCEASLLGRPRPLLRLRDLGSPTGLLAGPFAAASNADLQSLPGEAGVLGLFSE